MRQNLAALAPGRPDLTEILFVLFKTNWRSWRAMMDFAQEYAPLSVLLRPMRLYPGTDGLPMNGHLQLDEQEFASFDGELKEWNEKILMLLDAESFARPQRRYLLWKALADVGCLLSLIRDPSSVGPLNRAEAVSFLAKMLPEALRPSIAALQGEHASHFLADKMSGAQRFDLWRGVFRSIAGQLEGRAAIPAAAVVAHAEPWMRDRDARLQTVREIAPSDACCTLTDFFFVPSNPLDVDGYGSLARIIRMPRPLLAEEYGALKRAFRRGKLFLYPGI